MTIKYTEPVTFTKTDQYGCGPDNEDDVYTIEGWVGFCKSGAFIDYDGYGQRVKDGKAGGPHVYPSMVTKGTFDAEDATHIVWYNR